MQKKIFAKERYEHPHPRVNQRMDALHMKHKGVSNNDICMILDICNNTLLSYFKMQCRLVKAITSSYSYNKLF